MSHAFNQVPPAPVTQSYFGRDATTRCGVWGQTAQRLTDALWNDLAEAPLPRRTLPQPCAPAEQVPAVSLLDDIHVFVLVHGTMDAATTAFVELAAERGVQLTRAEARAHLDAQLEVA